MNSAALLDALASGRVLLVGVVNVTPDSFSDGGLFLDRDAAVAHGRRLRADGADLVDVGGESTRPGAEPVSVDEELRRVLPVVRGLVAAGVAVSIDTRRAEVADAALQAGAVMLNDVGGLRDPAMRVLAARHRVPAVAMHMSVPDPSVMQQHTDYGNVVAEVVQFLAGQAAVALADGVPAVVLDPGIGFGKTLEHNLELLTHLDDLVQVGHPVMVGASRKRFLGTLTGVDEPSERLGATLAAHLAAVQHGARLVRAHDVAAHRQALTVWSALQRPAGAAERDRRVAGRRRRWFRGEDSNPYTRDQNP